MIITFQYILYLVIALILTAIAIPLEAKTFLRNIILTLLVITIVYLCILNFPLTLTLLVFVTGIIALIDILFFVRKRKAKQGKPNAIVENARGFFPILLIVWIIRSFIIQPYHVPTGSLEPTVMAGDFIAVNQFAYGLKFPVLNTKLVPVGEPKIGDIVLFYYPPDPSVVFVKRVIGIPGTHIVYKNKVLYIDGKEAAQQDVGSGFDVEPGQQPIYVQKRLEDLNGVKHEIFVLSSGGETQDFDITVPAEMYFMMGDNRDDSGDSRMWGYVPERNLIGKAFIVLLSWDSDNSRMRWDRIGNLLH